jgi:uncharacterized membrane protein
MTTPAADSRSKGRVEAFSDGVFAIAITLLVLEIIIPHVDGSHLLGELLKERQMVLAYFVAFMTIGAVWIEHTALVDALDHVDGVFMRLNLLLLLFVAFLPLPTGLMGEYASDRPGERVAVVFFGLVLLLQTLMLIVMGRHAEREDLFGAGSAEERREESRVKYQLGPSLVFYAVAAVIGFVLPYAGAVLYLLIAVYLAVPLKTVRRVLGRRAAAMPDDH